MKSKRAHVVPLSDPALAILDERRGLHKGARVRSERTDRALSQMGLARTVQNIAGSIHGFRSSFRDWASEETAHDFAVVETALAHAVGSRVEQVYRRDDLLAKRRMLMDAWAEYLAGRGRRRTGRTGGRDGRVRQGQAGEGERRNRANWRGFSGGCAKARSPRRLRPS